MYANRRLYAGEPFTKAVTIDKRPVTAARSYPPIIDQEMVAKLDALVPVRPNRTVKVGPLRGFVECTCGQPGRMTSSTKNAAGQQYFYYACASLNRERTNKLKGFTFEVTSCRKNIGHLPILNAVLDYLTGPESTGSPSGRVAEAELDLKRIGDQLQAAQHELVDAHQTLADRRTELNQFITEAQTANLTRVLSVFNDQLEAAESDVDRVQAEMERLHAEGAATVEKLEQFGELQRLGAEQFASIKTEQLKTAIDECDWETGQAVLASIRINVLCDFSTGEIIGMKEL